ncbi:MAG TPA: hypothetical protein VNL71_17610 [Chloroflexota bacterium]|nr:hypothetical protein [Chloroflexota bacterium]
MQLLAGGSAIVLVAAIVILVHAFTSGPGGPSVSGGAGAFISKAPTGLVLGKPIDGIGCNATEGSSVHVHTHLDVIINGQTKLAPSLIGYDTTHNCLYWVHTHLDSPGAIHIEAPVAVHPTLGDFLDIWAATPTKVEGYTVDHSLLNTILSQKPSVVALDGQPYNGDIRAIPLGYHTMITLGYGVKTVVQKPYDFTLVG